MQMLGTLGGSSSDAFGMNNWNVVVGVSDVDEKRFTPYTWTSTDGMVNLNSVISPDSGWTLGLARAINDSGQITGYGLIQEKWEAYRLDPIPPKLSLQRSPTNILVSWSPAWSGLVLESTPSLSAPDWQSVDTGGTNVLMVSATNTMRFFRLNLDGIRGLCCGAQ